MLKMVRSWFAWTVVRDTGGCIYSVNTVTGTRRVKRRRHTYHPIDWHWLKTGEWSNPEDLELPYFAERVRSGQDIEVAYWRSLMDSMTPRRFKV